MTASTPLPERAPRQFSRAALRSERPWGGLPASRHQHGAFKRVWLGLTSLLFANALEGVIAETSLTMVLVFLLTAYLLMEIRHERRVDPRHWLVNPAVAASIGTFLLSAVIPSITFFIPDSYSSYVAEYQLDAGRRFHWINLTLTWTMAGAIAMWVGYRLRLGSDAGQRIASSGIAVRYLRDTFDVKLFAAVALCGVAVMTRLLQASMGVYGYSSEEAALTANAAILQWLFFAAELLKYVMMAAALAYFSRANRTPGVLLLLLAAFGAEIIFSGFLAGFKGGVFFPVVTIGTCYYWFNSRIPKSFLAGGLFLLFIAYAVVEPFRALRYTDPNFDGRSIRGISRAVMAVIESDKATSVVVDQDARLSTFALRVGDRLNLLTYAAIAIKYREEHEVLPDDAPKFLRDILISPVLAFIPRAVWPDKPIQNTGLWFNRIVIESPTFSSVAIGPVGYLYLAGRGLMVIAGFLLAGIFLKFVWAAFRNSPGGVFIYLGLLPTLTFIDNAYYTFFSANIQLIVVLFFVQQLLVRRSRGHIRPPAREPQLSAPTRIPGERATLAAPDSA